MTAAELINEARDFHTSFSPLKHGDTLCLRELSRAQKRFYTRLTAQGGELALAKEAVFDTDDIANALAGEPLTLPAYVKLVNAAVVAAESLYRVSIQATENPNGRNSFVGRLVGRNLYLAQPEELQDEVSADLRTNMAALSPWADADTLRVTYVPFPKDMDALDDELAAPDDAKGYFVASLVDFMARRSNDVPLQERRELIVRAQADQDDVFQAYMMRDSNETEWYVSP